MKTQTATIRGFQHGRPIELHSHGAFAALTAPGYAQEDKPFTVPIYLVGNRGETLLFGPHIV